MTDVFSFNFPRNLSKLEDKELASRVSKFLATYGSDIHEKTQEERNVSTKN